MTRLAALLWFVVVMCAGGYLSLRIYHGLQFRTDLMALLPQEEQNPALKHTNDLVTKALSRRVVVLVGHKDKAAARAAATEIARQLTASGLFDIATDSFDKTQLRQMGTFYYPYRFGLLSDADRELLKSNQGQAIAARALSQVYGVIGLANEKLLHDDPFLLMPSFLTSLPIPLSRLSMDDGMLSLQNNGTTWVLISGQIKGEPFALDVQKQISEVFDQAIQSERNAYPDLEVLHLGAVFFAKAGAEEAMSETSVIGVVSTLGTILLIMAVFRAIRPLILSLLVIGVGVMTALAASLLIFGELHVGALLFGISLIGVSVDYSLQYCSEVFSPHSGSPQQRLQRVLVGITLGTATTVIGYMTLYLAPFPGLHQIAAFSAVGLMASWITVVLWLPMLDQKKVVAHGQSMLMKAEEFLAFGEDKKHRRSRICLLALVVVLGIAGFSRFHTDDNVRRMQSLSADLVMEQEKIQKLIGTTAGSQFFLVQAPDDETALQSEEKLTEKLHSLVVSGALGGFQTPSQYIPSAARQMENRMLQREHLYDPLLAQQAAQLGLADKPEMPDDKTPPLTIADAKKLDNPPAFLSTLLLDDAGGEVTHMVSLDAVSQPEALAAAAEGLQGVRYVDPASDFSQLLGKYRSRSIRLLALSAVLMAPLLIWRYGLRKGLWVMVPPLLSVILTPALRGLAGGSFTFFDAMALVLVLSIGVDYAVFCAETTEERKSVTILAVTMAACTALLSFGLLALSKVAAVHNFGATMTLGILLSFLFAPMARLASRERIGLSFRNIISVALVFILCSCDTPSVEENKPGVVQIAPDLTLSMPTPADLGRSVEVAQLVTAHYGNKTFAFEAHISATPEHFLLVGLDLMGRKLMTIDWTKDKIFYETASWVPSQLRSENVLADIVLLYWPDTVVQKSLAMSGGKLIVKSGVRTVTSKGKNVWQANYQSKSKNDPWSGQLNYRNLAWGYNFNVQSAEQAP
jgi:predicted exporter